MDQYEIRVHQLRRKKIGIFFRIFVIVAILLLICLMFYFYYLKSNTKLIITLFFLFSGLLIVFVFFFLLLIENKKYKKFYLECLYSECKLDEIFLLNHKITKNKLFSSFIRKAYNIKSFKQTHSFSDASREFSMDVINIIYKKNKGRQKGTILFVQYDLENNGFIQLTHSNKCSFDVYDNQEVMQYGTSAGSLLKKMHIFSTYKIKTYLLEKAEYSKAIVLLEKYFSTPIDIIFASGQLYIFIDQYSLQLEDNVFNFNNNLRFSDKIESIHNFHKVCFDVIELFNELFIKEDTN